MPAFCNADRFLSLHLVQMRSHAMLSKQPMVSGSGNTCAQGAVANQTGQQVEGRAKNLHGSGAKPVLSIQARVAEQVGSSGKTGSLARAAGNSNPADVPSAAQAADIAPRPAETLWFQENPYSFKNLANYFAQLFGILSKKPGAAGSPDFEKDRVAEGEQVMAKIVMTCHFSELELSSGKFEAQVKDALKGWQRSERKNLLFRLQHFLQKLNSREGNKHNASALFFRRIAEICLSKGSSRQITGRGAGYEAMSQQKAAAGYGKIDPEAQAEERIVLGLPHVGKNGYEEGALPLGAIPSFPRMESAGGVDESVGLYIPGKPGVPFADFPDTAQFEDIDAAAD